MVFLAVALWVLGLRISAVTLVVLIVVSKVVKTVEGRELVNRGKRCRV